MAFILNWMEWEHSIYSQVVGMGWCQLRHQLWLGPRWGMEYGDLIRVKVRFLNRSQTVAKLRKDVAHRSSELTTLEDGSILLQDNIIGVNEFITWVLGFGSAAEIIEPVELRELILDRIRKTLGNYKAEVSKHVT